MTAFSHTDWTVHCDHPLCGRSERTDTIDRNDVKTAADVRKWLRRRGWAVALPHPNLEIRQRVDYCPQHKPEQEG